MGTVLTRIITYLVTSSATVSGMGPHPILFSPLPSFLRSAILIVGKGLSRSCLVLNWAHCGVSGSLGNAEEMPIWTKCSRVVLQQIWGCLTFDPRKNHTIFQRHIRFTILETKENGWFDWVGIHYPGLLKSRNSRPITSYHQITPLALSKKCNKPICTNNENRSDSNQTWMTYRSKTQHDTSW